MFTFTFIFMGIGAALFFVALIQWVFDGFSVNRDILAFAIVSFLSIVVARRIYRKRSDQHKTAEEDVNQY